MRRGCLFVLLAAAAIARAELTYTVAVTSDPGNLHVTIRIPNTVDGAKLQIPNWAPGSYRLVDNYKNVKNLKATDPSGRELKIDQTIDKLKKDYGDDPDRKTAENDVCTWSVAPAPATTVEYDMASVPLDGSMHWSGPSTYIYPVGRTQERCVLQIELPQGWKAYTGLDERKNSPNAFDAKTYDVLADNPVSTGDVLVDTYVSRGKPHTIVMRGRAKANVDRAYLIKACKFVSDMQTDLMGGAPYEKYIWHFNVNDAPDGAGGLEHLSSTQISLAAGVGPRAVSVLSHEFFHLWNVKRIRSRVLGPFDYTKLPDTGALWWLEGTTDYFAHQLLYRYSWWNQDALIRDVLQNMDAVTRNPAYQEVGPNEASLRVGEASNGRGNSNGWRISYYNLGWLAGMILDIEMREKTRGKHTLDDVLLALWRECKDDQPGFEEDEIRRQLVKFGGMDMGWVYDAIVMKPGPMPIEATLKRVGLRIVEKDETFADLGFSAFPDTDGGRVMNPGGAVAGKLQAGDFIIAVGGKSILGTRRSVSSGIAELMAGAKVGTPIKLSVKRGQETLEVEVTPVQGTRKARTIDADPSASADAKALGANWLAQKKL